MGEMGRRGEGKYRSEVGTQEHLLQMWAAHLQAARACCLSGCPYPVMAGCPGPVTSLFFMVTGQTVLATLHHLRTGEDITL